MNRGNLIESSLNKKVSLPKIKLQDLRRTLILQTVFPSTLQSPQLAAKLKSPHNLQKSLFNLISIQLKMQREAILSLNPSSKIF